MMHLKRMVLALCACLIVGAAIAGAAQAASWKVGAEKAPLAEETVSIFGGPWTLSSAPLGIEVIVTAEEVGCTPGHSCRISGEGHSEGGLTFTGATVDKPAGCTARTPGDPVGTITTVPLTDQLTMPDESDPTATYDKFFPQNGSTWFTLVFGGGTCPLAGLEIPIEGSLYGRANDTGAMAVNQPLVFNAAEEATAGSTLEEGGAPVALTGTAHSRLNGSNEGRVFGAE